MGKSKNVKVDRHSLAKDEVAESLEDVLSTIRRNVVKIVSVVAVAVALVIGVSVYRIRAEQTRVDASRVLQSAAIIFNQLPALEDEAERKRRLQATIDELDRLIADHEGTPVGLQALHLKGTCYYYMADPSDRDQARRDLDNAVAAFERFIERAKTDLDRARGRNAIGLAKENGFLIGEEDPRILAEAERHYGEAQKLAPEGSFILVEALMNQARVLELTSRDQAAAEIYRRILRERPAPRTKPPFPDTGEAFSLDSFIRDQSEQGMDVLSFYFSAKIALERLEASGAIVTPPDSGSGNL